MNFTQFATNGRNIIGFDEHSGTWQPVEREVYDAHRQRQRERNPIGDAIWGGLEQFSQGASLGASDEIAAGLAAIPRLIPGGESYMEAYRRNRDALRARARQFEAQNPNTAMALEGLGGAVTGAATAPLAGVGAVGSSLGANLAKSAALGAMEGGTAGMMSSDEKALENGLVGMGFGALAGVAAPATAGALGWMGSLAGKIGQALAMGPEARARKQARDLLDRMGMDEQQFTVRMRNMGPDAIFADISEDAAQELRAALAKGRTSATTQAENVLEERARSGSERVLSAAQQTMRADDSRLEITLRALDEQRRRQARQDYGVVYAQTPPLTEDLEKILKLDPIQEAFKEANKLRGFDPDAEPLPELFTRNPDGSSDITQYPTVEMWDHIKRGLDAIIEGNTNDFGRVNATGAEAAKLKRRLLENLDSQIEGYRAARSAYAGTSALMESARRGRNIFNEEYEILADDLDNMGQSERQAFKLGAFNAVRDEVESTRMRGTSASRQKLGSEKYLRRLRAAFDNDEDFSRFRQQLDRELNMQRTRNVALYGSDTARSLLRAQEQDAEAAIMEGAQAATGQFIPAVVSRVGEALTSGPRVDMTRDLYARALLSGGPEALSFVRPSAGAPMVPRFQPGAGTGALIGAGIAMPGIDTQEDILGLLGY